MEMIETPNGEIEKKQPDSLPSSLEIFGLYQNLRLSLSNFTCGYLMTSGNSSVKRY